MKIVGEGLKRTLVTTGEIDNVVIIRKGSDTEIQSIIQRDQASIIEMHPAIAIDARGVRQAAKECVESQPMCCCQTDVCSGLAYASSFLRVDFADSIRAKRIHGNISHE